MYDPYLYDKPVETKSALFINEEEETLRHPSK